MISYEIVDVFTGTPFEGNPLAVVFGGDGLSDKQLQAIAAEFNLSETAFVLPPTTTADYRVRIFTPKSEIPFAGHPSIGTAVTLARRGDIADGTATQECGAGLLPVVVDGDAATLTGGTPTDGGPLDAAPLLELAGLEPSDLAGNARRVGTGIEFPILPVIPEAVARAENTRIAGQPEVYLFSFDATTGRAHSRLFAPGFGITEDPATGSAALALGVHLVAEGLVPADGTTSYVVDQGAEMGRPSRLECQVDAAAGAAVRARVRGRAVAVSRGEFVSLP